MVYKTKEITTPNSVYEQPKQQSHFYKGFSSIGTNVGNTQLFDFELIKQDILNHFNTKKGERLMNPEFGSLIWDLLMEPLTEQTRELLKNDILYDTEAFLKEDYDMFIMQMQKYCYGYPQHVHN